MVGQKRHSSVVPSWLPTHGRAHRAPHLLKQIKIKEDLPSSSSRLAPPPVLTWLTLSSVFHLAQQVAVSPPPVAQTESMRYTRNSNFVQLKAQAGGGLEENIFITVLSITSFLHAFRNTRTQLLTNNGDAAFSSYFYHFVHQGLGSFGKLVPLEDPNWTVPHNLLGPSHNFNKLLHTLRAAVQALQEVKEITHCWSPDQNHHAQPEACPSPQTWNNRQICQQLLQEGGVWQGGIYLPNTSKSVLNQCQILKALARKLCQPYLNSSQKEGISTAFRSACWEQNFAGLIQISQKLL